MSDNETGSEGNEKDVVNLNRDVIVNNDGHPNAQSNTNDDSVPLTDAPMLGKKKVSDNDDENDTESDSENDIKFIQKKNKFAIMLYSWWESKKQDNNSKILSKLTNMCTVNSFCFGTTIFFFCCWLLLVACVTITGISIESREQNLGKQNLDLCYVNSCSEPFLFINMGNVSLGNFKSIAFVLLNGCNMQENNSLVVQSCNVSLLRSSRIQMTYFEQNYLIMNEQMLSSGFSCIKSFGVDKQKCCITPNECGYADFNRERDILIAWSIPTTLIILFLLTYCYITSSHLSYLVGHYKKIE